MENFPGSQENLESQEKHEFTIEEIQNLLKQIDGKERPNLAIKETKNNLKGELIYIIFTNGEKEIEDGQESDITYNLEVAGQRYNPDGSLGRFKGQTEISKDYDDGVYSVALGEYIDGVWTNLQKIDPPLEE